MEYKGYDENVLQQGYQYMYQAMIGKDSISLSGLLDDSFVLVHMTGMCQDKKQFILAVMDGELNYYSVKNDEFLVVDIDKNHASAIGRSRVDAAVFGGSRHTWRLQQKLEYEKKNGIWLITRSTASVY